MKKIFMFVTVFCFATSCSDSWSEDFEETTAKSEYYAEKAKGENIGIRLSLDVLDLASYCADIKIMPVDTTDINSLVSAIKDIETQHPYFDDAIEDTGTYEKWLEWYTEQYN